MPQQVTKEQITGTLLLGLKEFIAHVNDGLIDVTHWEHYSEDPCNRIDPKIYHLHVLYRKVEVSEM